LAASAAPTSTSRREDDVERHVKSAARLLRRGCAAHVIAAVARRVAEVPLLPFRRLRRGARGWCGRASPSTRKNAGGRRVTGGGAPSTGRDSPRASSAFGRSCEERLRQRHTWEPFKRAPGSVRAARAPYCTAARHGGRTLRPHRRTLRPHRRTLRPHRRSVRRIGVAATEESAYATAVRTYSTRARAYRGSVVRSPRRSYASFRRTVRYPHTVRKP